MQQIVCSKCGYQISSSVKRYCEKLWDAHTLQRDVYLCPHCQVKHNLNSFDVYKNIKLNTTYVPSEKAKDNMMKIISTFDIAPRIHEINAFIKAKKINATDVEINSILKALVKERRIFPKITLQDIWLISDQKQNIK